jgi:uncharacterized protein (DUF433 family)
MIKPIPFEELTDDGFEYELTPAQSNARREADPFEEFRTKIIPSWGLLLVTDERSRDAEVLAFRIFTSMQMMHESVEIDPTKRGGVPVIRGTRFPVSRFLADLAEHGAVKEIADDYDISVIPMKEFLVSLSIQLDRPFSHDDFSIRPMPE